MSEEGKPASRVRCLVGLGNPGPDYARTRHNAGFLVLDRLAPSAGWRRDGTSAITRETIEGIELLLVCPLTYMNRSGVEVARILAAEGMTPLECLVVSDDVTLSVGRLRFRLTGSSGGHRGLLSIEGALATRDYPRLRIGVGAQPPGVDLADFVLEPLVGDAWSELLAAAEKGAEALRFVLQEGVEAAMNRFNSTPAD